MSKSYWELNKERFVREALSGSLKKNATAEYNVIRYAQMGLITYIEDTMPKEFIDWYPRNTSYVLLRLAHQGRLKYKDSTDV